jgi:hypothetical protein
MRAFAEPASPSYRATTNPSTMATKNPCCTPLEAAFLLSQARNAYPSNAAPKYRAMNRPAGFRVVPYRLIDAAGARMNPSPNINATIAVMIIKVLSFIDVPPFGKREETE